MNATKWHTLTDFVKHLGREGYCIVDETPKVRAERQSRKGGGKFCWGTRLCGSGSVAVSICWA